MAKKQSRNKTPTVKVPHGPKVTKVETPKLIPAAISVRQVAAEEKGYIHPLVRFNGEEHLLETLNQDEDTAPVMEAIGYMKIDREKNYGWVSYKVSFKGDKVLKIEISSPDMREIAEDNAKTSFVENFMDKGLG